MLRKRGVLTDPLDDNSVMGELTEPEFLEYQESGIISSGMIPKLYNGFKAIHNGVSEVLITNPENFYKGRGTRLVKS